MASFGPYDEHSPTTGRSPFVDPLLWVGLVVWALSILPSFVPIWSAESTGRWAELYSGLPPLVMALVLFLAASRSLASRGREFWLLLSGATAIIVINQVMYALVPWANWGESVGLVHDTFYLLSYLPIALALERRPDRNPSLDQSASLRQLETVGTLVFLFGMLGYFIVIPSVYNPGVYATLLPSLMLYVALDSFIVVRVLALLYSQPRTMWLWPYRMLGLTFSLWLIADLWEALLWAEAVPSLDSGTPLDVVWHLPLLGLVLTARAPRWPYPAETASREMPAVLPHRVRPGGHRLTVLAMTLPILHFVMATFGLTDPASERAQMALLTVMILSLGAMLVRYQRLLRGMASAMEADRALVSNQLQMAQRMEAVGRLAAGVAHDFSNVLSVIRGRAELLLMSRQLSAQAQDDVEEAVDAARRGQALVTHLLAISRRKAGDPHTLDLSDVTKDVKDLLARVLPERITLSLEGSDQRPLVVADRAQLEQVVLNLILNSRDAIQGRGLVRVRTDVVEVDDQFAAAHGGEAGGLYAQLSVSDNGPGVPPQMRELVFEPFFSTKDDDLGSGVGLSVVYGIVRQARGFIRLADSDDGGALFEVYLPLGRGLPSWRSRSEGGRPLPGRETVLLVDNHGPVRRTSARILRESGYRVIEAESAMEALAMLDRRNERIDVLVTDVDLPDLPGPELRTRALAQNSDLAVVLVSGQPEGVTPIHAPEDTLVLRKPLAPDLLAMSVRRALAQARAHEE